MTADVHGTTFEPVITVGGTVRDLQSGTAKVELVSANGRYEGGRFVAAADSKLPVDFTVVSGPARVKPTIRS